MKIAIIGAGSSYTPEILEGLLDIEAFAGMELCLYDIPEGEKEAAIIYGLAKRMANAKNARAAIVLENDLDKALEGCDFVVSQFRQGRLAARVQDEHIPLQYGLLGQETTGAGGFFNAMRTVPEAMRIAQRMEKLCPDAWLINFTNPAGIVTEAVQTYTRAKVVGLCNVPYNMHMDAAGLLGVEPARVYCVVAGLNHLSFVCEILLDGKPVLQDMIDRGLFTTQLVKNIPKVAGVDALIKTLGLVPSPYLQYFYFEQQMLEKQRAELASGAGTRGEQVLGVQAELFRIYADEATTGKPEALGMRGGSYYSTVAAMLMRALAGDGPVVTPVNTRNNGAIADLPPDCVVETNCQVDKNGVRPLAFGHLPAGVAGLVQQVKRYETLTVQAAVENDRQKALQALLNNPLVHGYSNAQKLLGHLP